MVFLCIPIQAQAPFLLTDVTYSSDIPFDEREFFYLTGLRKESVINYDKIEHAKSVLCYKAQCKKVLTRITDNHRGKSIHFHLIHKWIIKKVESKGIAFGKEQYLRLYKQQPGACFDATQHEESLSSISKKLNAEGYFNHTIDDEIIYNPQLKQITILLTLKRDRRFTISNISYKSRKKSIDQELYKKFSALLSHSYYIKKRVHKQAHAIRHYLKTEGFSNSRIDFEKSINKKNNTVSIKFNIELGKKFIPSFTGNQALSDKFLLQKLALDDQPDWLLSPLIICEQIVYEYFKNGYWETQAVCQEVDDGHYLFSIKEGKKSFINNIILSNTKAGISEPLPSSWETLIREQQFNLQLLSEKIRELEAQHFSQGFWDFSIQEKRFVKTKENECTVNLLINKGTQRLLKKYTISSLPELTNKGPLKKYTILNKQGPTPFNTAWLHEDKAFIISQLQKQGYWHAQVKPTFLTEDSSDGNIHVSLDWDISTGKKVRFGKVLVGGNSKLPFKRIIREIMFQEGELWSKDKIELTRKKLKRFDLFKHVYMQPISLRNNRYKKPVALTLIEENPIELRLRTGYFLTSKNFLFKRQSTPKIGTTLIIRNPSNRADKITFDVDLTKFERKSSVMYQQPSFLNLPIIGKIQGYANKYVHPVQVASSTSAYEAIQSGLLCSISNEYKKNYYWALTIGNEWQKTSRVRGNLNLSKKIIDTTIPYFFMEPSIIIDTLDDKINTKKGSFTFCSLKCMVPEHHGNFTARLLAEQSLFFPIYKKVILAFRIRAGHIFRRAFNHIMPIERFYLGGPYSVRGYGKDALPPFGESTVIKDGKPHKQFTIQGGGTMINTNLELRIPLINKLHGVIFQDVGALSQSGFLGIKNKWHPTSGVGLRYKTPIGSLRFDIGWKWKKRSPNDTPYAWYLTLGEAF